MALNELALAQSRLSAELVSARLAAVFWMHDMPEGLKRSAHLLAAAEEELRRLNESFAAIRAASHAEAA